MNTTSSTQPVYRNGNSIAGPGKEKALAAYTGFTIAAVDAKQEETDDETAIYQRFAQLVAAWGAGDAEAYGALFTEDADYVAFDGVNQKGREAIIAGHKPLFERFLKGSTLTGGLVSVCLLAPNVALAHAVGSILDSGRRTPKAERLSSQTLLAIKENGTWRFRAFHNTRVRPIGQGRGFFAWLIADLAWRFFGPKP